MSNNTENPMSSETHHRDLKPDEPDFKSIRESRGLTLKDIFKKTRISVTTLSAIENSDFHLLPPPVFTKSFIKIYAKYLGVESSSTLARYEQYLKTLDTAYRNAETKKPPVRVRVNYLRFLWITTIIVVAVSATFILFCQKSHIEVLQDKPVESAPAAPLTTAANETPTDPQRNSPSPIDVAQKAEKNVVPTTTDSPVQHTTHEAARKPDIQNKDVVLSQTIISTHKETKEKYPLIMEARELTWLRIKADHNPPYEILLKPGEKIEKSASQFIIDIGNAGGIAIEFQGKSLGNLGKQGEVVHLTLP
jgi:cytoskeleton protein RodZ